MGIENGRNFCSILKNAYGMEYFISNENANYLVAVNWYVIEGAGSVNPFDLVKGTLSLNSQ